MATATKARKRPQKPPVQEEVIVEESAPSDPHDPSYEKKRVPFGVRVGAWFSRQGERARRAGRWMGDHLVLLWGKTKRGAAWVGRQAWKGTRAVGRGLVRAVGLGAWLCFSAIALVLVGVVLVVAVALMLVSLVAWLVTAFASWLARGAQYVAYTGRWLMMSPKNQEKDSLGVYLYSKMGGMQRELSKPRAWLIYMWERLTTGLFGPDVMVTVNEWYDDRDESEDLAQYYERTKDKPWATPTDPWTAKDDPRMDDYSGMSLHEVLERHNHRLNYVTDNQDGMDPKEAEQEMAFWSGRIYFLEYFMEDEDNLTKMESLYKKWRLTQPKRGGLLRGKFHAGMLHERNVLQELVAKREAAASAGKNPE